MILIHDKTARGTTRMGWLESQHTFSFGSFHDPKRMGFGALRVINEDRIAPGSGFPAHGHASMDILTYVLEGALRHKDSEGNVSEIAAGQMQLMSAGSGITHSEYNASDSERAHFLQIWMVPDTPGGTPRYAETDVPQTGDALLAGGDGSNALLPLRSEAQLALKRADSGAEMAFAAPSDADLFVHVLEGLAEAEGERISAGDGLQMPAGEDTCLTWKTDGAVLVFTLPNTTKETLQ